MEKRHVLILKRDIAPQDEAIASNALSAMVKTLDCEVKIVSVTELHGAISPEVKYVFFYPDFSQISTMDHLIKENPGTTFIMTTASAKERSFSPDPDGDKFKNFKILPRPFSVNTLKEMLV